MLLFLKYIQRNYKIYLHVQLSFITNNKALRKQAQVFSKLTPEDRKNTSERMLRERQNFAAPLLIPNLCKSIVHTRNSEEYRAAKSSLIIFALDVTPRLRVYNRYDGLHRIIQHVKSTMTYVVQVKIPVALYFHCCAKITHREDFIA